MMDKDPHDSLWILICFAMACGLAGELYRADKENLSWMQIGRRFALRSLFCSLSAVIVGFLCLSAQWDTYAVLAVSGIAGLLGADITLALFERLLYVKFGVKRDGDK